MSNIATSPNSLVSSPSTNIDGHHSFSHRYTSSDDANTHQSSTKMGHRDKREIRISGADEQLSIPSYALSPHPSSISPYDDSIPSHRRHSTASSSQFSSRIFDHRMQSIYTNRHLLFGICSLQGGRPTMEDAHKAIPQVKPQMVEKIAKSADEITKKLFNDQHVYDYDAYQNQTSKNVPIPPQNLLNLAVPGRHRHDFTSFNRKDLLSYIEKTTQSLLEQYPLPPSEKNPTITVISPTSTSTSIYYSDEQHWAELSSTPTSFYSLSSQQQHQQSFGKLAVTASQVGGTKLENPVQLDHLTESDDEENLYHHSLGRAPPPILVDLSHHSSSAYTFRTPAASTVPTNECPESRHRETTNAMSTTLSALSIDPEQSDEYGSSDGFKQLDENIPAMPQDNVRVVDQIPPHNLLITASPGKDHIQRIQPHYSPTSTSFPTLPSSSAATSRFFSQNGHPSHQQQQHEPYLQGKGGYHDSAGDISLTSTTLPRMSIPSHHQQSSSGGYAPHSSSAFGSSRRGEEQSSFEQSMLAIFEPPAELMELSVSGDSRPTSSVHSTHSIPSSCHNSFSHRSAEPGLMGSLPDDSLHTPASIGMHVDVVTPKYNGPKPQADDTRIYSPTGSMPLETLPLYTVNRQPNPPPLTDDEKIEKLNKYTALGLITRELFVYALLTPSDETSLFRKLEESYQILATSSTALHHIAVSSDIQESAESGVEHQEQLEQDHPKEQSPPTTESCPVDGNDHHTDASMHDLPLLGLPPPQARSVMTETNSAHSDDEKCARSKLGPIQIGHSQVGYPFTTCNFDTLSLDSHARSSGGCHHQRQSSSTTLLLPSFDADSDMESSPLSSPRSSSSSSSSPSLSPSCSASVSSPSPPTRPATSSSSSSMRSLGRPAPEQPSGITRPSDGSHNYPQQYTHSLHSQSPSVPCVTPPDSGQVAPDETIPSTLTKHPSSHHVKPGGIVDTRGPVYSNTNTPTHEPHPYPDLDDDSDMKTIISLNFDYSSSLTTTTASQLSAGCSFSHPHSGCADDLHPMPRGQHRGSLSPDALLSAHTIGDTPQDDQRQAYGASSIDRSPHDEITMKTLTYRPHDGDDDDDDKIDVTGRTQTLPSTKRQYSTRRQSHFTSSVPHKPNCHLQHRNSVDLPPLSISEMASGIDDTTNDGGQPKALVPLPDQHPRNQRYSHGHSDTHNSLHHLQHKRRHTTLKPSSNLSGYFCVCDGHGGIECSSWISQNLPLFLFAENSDIIQHYKSSLPIVGSIQRAFCKLETQWNHIARATQLDSGSTIACALTINGYLYVANVGDSEVVLSRSKRAVSLTSPHNPKKNPAERRRLIQTGAKLSSSGRVCHPFYPPAASSLGLSRCIGNLLFKEIDVNDPVLIESSHRNHSAVQQTRQPWGESSSESPSGGTHSNVYTWNKATATHPTNDDTDDNNSGENTQDTLQKVPLLSGVISEPEIRVIPIIPCDEFLIIACDGLWDVVTPQRAVDIVHEMLTRARLCKVSMNWTYASEVLAKMAVSLGSRDNVTVCCVSFLEVLPTIPSANNPSAATGSSLTTPPGGRQMYSTVSHPLPDDHDHTQVGQRNQATTASSNSKKCPFTCNPGGHHRDARGQAHQPCLPTCPSNKDHSAKQLDARITSNPVYITPTSVRNPYIAPSLPRHRFTVCLPSGDPHHHHYQPNKSKTPHQSDAMAVHSATPQLTSRQFPVYGRQQPAATTAESLNRFGNGTDDRLNPVDGSPKSTQNELTSSLSFPYGATDIASPPRHHVNEADGSNNSPSSKFPQFSAPRVGSMSGPSLFPLSLEKTSHHSHTNSHHALSPRSRKVFPTEKGKLTPVPSSHHSTQQQHNQQQQSGGHHVDGSQSTQGSPQGNPAHKCSVPAELHYGSCLAGTEHHHFMPCEYAFNLQADGTVKPYSTNNTECGPTTPTGHSTTSICVQNNLPLCYCGDKDCPVPIGKVYLGVYGDKMYLNPSSTAHHHNSTSPPSCTGGDAHNTSTGSDGSPYNQKTSHSSSHTANTSSSSLLFAFDQPNFDSESSSPGLVPYMSNGAAKTQPDNPHSPQSPQSPCSQHASTMKCGTEADGADQQLPTTPLTPDSHASGLFRNIFSPPSPDGESSRFYPKPSTPTQVKPSGGHHPHISPHLAFPGHGRQAQQSTSLFDLFTIPSHDSG